MLFRRRRLYKSCGCLQRFTHPHSGCGLSRSTSGGDASIAVGNYAIFTSGLVVGSDGVGSFVGNTSCDVYNASLTKTTVTLLSVARVYMSAGTVGDYALLREAVVTLHIQM